MIMIWSLNPHDVKHVPPFWFESSNEPCERCQKAWSDVDIRISLNIRILIYIFPFVVSLNQRYLCITRFSSISKILLNSCFISCSDLPLVSMNHFLIYIGFFSLFWSSWNLISIIMNLLTISIPIISKPWLTDGFANTKLRVLYIMNHQYESCLSIVTTCYSHYQQ